MTSAPATVATPADRPAGRALLLRQRGSRGTRLPQPNSARRIHRIQRILYPLILLAALLGLWQYFASGMKNRLLIPTFTEVAGAIIPTLTSGEVWHAMWLSNQALFLGFGASILIGVPAGLALGRFSWLERTTNSYIDILLVLPMAAVIPLLVAQFGLGLFTRSLVVFLFAFVMIVVNARAGIRSIDPALVEMARSYGGSERHVWRFILLPGSVAALLAGARIGLSRAVTGMIVGELILIPVGIGHLINEYQGFLKAADLYALVALVLAESLLLVAVANHLERKLLSWKQ